MPLIKFFPRDVMSGEYSKPGDIFTAMFFGAENTFKVIEHHGTFFMAEWQ